MQLTPTFLPLLLQFSGDFTQPTCVTFMALMTGWLLSHRRRFITELIQSSDSTHTGHHSRYHRFFSHAAWSLDAIGCTLARFLVTLFAPTGLVELAVDDTLCRKRGLNVYGAGMHYDPLLSSKGLKVCSLGSRLGRPLPARSLLPLGPFQGLGPPFALPPLPQPPGPDQGQGHEG